MTAERMTGGGLRLEPVIAELQQKVTGRYPEARFEVFEGEDPRGTYLRAIIDIEDTDEVVDLVVDPLLDLQVEQRLPLYFVASRSPERHQDQPRSGVEAGPAAAGPEPLP
ncbi:MAG: hypothetical protein IT306_10555 [Chloroflexi bacterium]|nr:hypothetical protein [Chloroflexota bacterium]